MSLPKFTKTWHNDVYNAIDPKRPALSVNGAVVVITRGESGIGPHIVKAFAQADAAKIAIIGRTKKALLEMKDLLQTRYPVTVCPFVADVSDTATVDKEFEAISALGAISVFINNTGYLPHIGSLLGSDIDEWLSGYEVNLKGSFLVTRAFLKNTTEGSVLINISSELAHVPPVPVHSAYGISKLAATKFFEYV